MKKAFMSIALVGIVTVLTGCCSSGGCGSYVAVSRPVVSVCNGCNTCSTCNTCGTCGYGYGYNDWY